MANLAPPHNFARTPLRPTAPIVPPASIAGRALVAVLAIMCFLACLSVGAMSMVMSAASDWQADVSREITIQIRPIEGVDIERELARAADLARDTPGIATVRVLTKAENERLLEPWLGAGISMDTLPIPRLIVLDTRRGAATDLAKLKADLARDLRGASLDDHRLWRQRLALMTNAVVGIGIIIMVLVLTATALSVVFATRGAMASNRDIVEVLHLVGADDAFIAREFQYRFMVLGLEGGAMGGLGAALSFLIAPLLSRLLTGSAGEAQLNMLFGSLSLGWRGFAGITITTIAIAAVSAVTSRLTVRRYLAGHT